MEKQLLTFSRQDAFKTCRRKHWFSHEVGLRKTTDAKALRFGTAGHAGLEVLHVTGDADKAIQAANDAFRSSEMETEEQILYDTYDRVTLSCLIAGYAWRWSGSKIRILETEYKFRILLKNPETGRPTPNFDLAGMIDGIIKLEDGRIAVREHKFLSEDLSPESALWKRLRIDHQITLYLIAGRERLYSVDSVLYDVVRKPNIRPNPVPVTDDDGVKIVLDADGKRVMNLKPKPVPVLDDDGLKIVLDWDNKRVMSRDGKKPRQSASPKDGFLLQLRDMTPEEWQEYVASEDERQKAKGGSIWRQSGSAEDGYELQTRPMTPEEWQDKLMADIEHRPEFYYACVEIPRLEQDVDECRAELWDIQKTLRAAQTSERWFRTCNRDTCAYCSYFELCCNNWTINDGIPDGFELVDDKNPELEGEVNHDDNSGHETERAPKKPEHSATGIRSETGLRSSVGPHGP